MPFRAPYKKMLAILCWIGATLSCGDVSMADAQANEIVAFLTGSWDNVSFEIADGKDVKREAYPETMVTKNADTLTITAHGIRKGQDLTKDMQLILRGDDITMIQGQFKASGKREGNVYTLRGAEGEAEYRFRLYAMGDRYVFHRETWREGRATAATGHSLRHR